MSGQIEYDLRQTVLKNDVGYLSPEEVTLFRKNDEMALKSLYLKISWEMLDLERNARKKMLLFLRENIGIYE